MKSRQVEAGFLKSLVYLAMGITGAILCLIVAYILIKGLPHLSPQLFSFHYTTENVSLFPALVNTVTMVALTLAISVPLGVGSAIYLVEYAPKGNRFVSLVRMTTETLQGIPSIVYGLFGALFFVNFCFKELSILAGALTLSIMVLPLIMRTSEEALKSVPDSYREGSFGLGAGKLRTIFRIILPAAGNGIFAGVVLAVGRIVGETAALIYTAGAVAQIPESVFGAGETLAIHIYKLWNEGLSADQSYATAVILLLLVLGINWLSDRFAKKMTKASA